MKSVQYPYLPDVRGHIWFKVEEQGFPILKCIVCGFPVLSGRGVTYECPNATE